MGHRVYLVPGFFGFANLGDLAYFGHVRAALLRAFETRGVPVDVHVVATWPTASLRRRAGRLVEAIEDSAAADDVVHVVGHSSGGLDARLATAPGVVLPTPADVVAAAARVRTIVTVATPHRGTPVAAFFASLLGQRALALLSLATIHLLRFGHLPLAVLLRLGAVFARLDALVGLNSLLLDELFAALLGDFSPERRAVLERLVGEIEREQALLPQLAPEAMDVFDAVVGDRPGVRTGCVVALGAPPGVLSQLGAGLDPSAHATHLVYQGLYRLASLTRQDLLPHASPAQAAALRTAFGTLPPPDANDGVVPTWSQLRGDVVAAVRADHLDVLGHFPDAEADPPAYDWMTSGSGFDRAAFVALWDAVAAFLLGGVPG